jgi:hypothetical protein
MTTSSSTTSPCSSPIPLGPGWSTWDLQLGRPGPSLHRQFPGHVRAPRELLGSPKLPPAARGVSSRLHPAILEAAHRATQRHRFGCHRRVPRRHHLPRPGEQAGSQDPHQGERADGHHTKFASGQEAVEAIFRKDKQPQGRPPEDVPEATTQRDTKKKGKKKSQAKRDAADADLVAATEYKNPRKPPGGANLFDKMLKESFPYH